MDADLIRQGIVEILPQLRRFAYSLTGTTHDADDLLQATVERLLDRGAPEDADIRKWSFRVCRNLWIDIIRARKVRINAAVTGKVGGDGKVDGERIVMDRITLMQVNTAMDALPVEQRAALSLVALEGFTYAEAADMLETPIGTIMSRIARARRALSNDLDLADKDLKGSGIPSGVIS